MQFRIEDCKETRHSVKGWKSITHSASGKDFCVDYDGKLVGRDLAISALRRLVEREPA